MQHFATVQMSEIWEALAPERAHSQWVNVWHVLALLRTYSPVEAAVERAISLRSRFCSSMHDIVDTCPQHVHGIAFQIAPFTAMGKGTRRCSGTPPSCPCTLRSAPQTEGFKEGKGQRVCGSCNALVCAR